MITPRHRHALLLAVIVLGGLLRLGAVGHGLPRHDLGQDEMITATRVRHGALEGHRGWPRFHWPNLNIHLSRAVIRAVRWVEGATGAAAHDDFLIGRIYTAVLGTLTLLALYLTAARLFDPWVGISAAAFLAVAPLHAFRSWLWVPDVPMTFFYTLALLAAARILARPSYPRFVAAALAVGLATATKYNGAGACLPVVVAAVLSSPALGRRWRWAALASRLALAAALALAVFFAVDWYALVRLDEVLEGVDFVRGRYIDAPASGLLGWHIWLYVLGSFFGGGYEGVGTIICLLALAGWGVLLRRGGRPALLAWLPALLYLLLFSSILHDPFERMFLPVVPHLALLAAVALVAGVRQVASRLGESRRGEAFAAALGAAVLLAAAVPATTQTVAARRGDTRLAAAAWLDSHVPAGAFLLREWDMVWPASRRFAFTRRHHELWEGDWTPRLVARYMDFVVVTSTNYERARRQRYRPAYARQAAYYDALLDGPMFELVARFEPRLDRFGPEVRVYRGLLWRGPVLGPARSEADLLRGRLWVSDPRLRRERQEAGGFRLRAPGEMVAGYIVVRPGGRYRLEVRVDSPGAAQVEAGLAEAAEVVDFVDRAVVRVPTSLEQGKAWWRVAAGSDLGPGAELTVRDVRLLRPGGAEEESAPSGGHRATTDARRIEAVALPEERSFR